MKAQIRGLFADKFNAMQSQPNIFDFDIRAIEPYFENQKSINLLLKTWKLSPEDSMENMVQAVKGWYGEKDLSIKWAVSDLVVDLSFLGIEFPNTAMPLDSWQVDNRLTHEYLSSIGFSVQMQSHEIDFGFEYEYWYTMEDEEKRYLTHQYPSKGGKDICLTIPEFMFWIFSQGKNEGIIEGESNIAKMIIASAEEKSSFIELMKKKAKKLNDLRT